MIRNTIIILLFTCACLKLQAQVNIITTIAGSNDTVGYCCDGQPATDAKLYVPEYLCYDKFGNIYVADCGNFRVRKIDVITNTITTIGGNGVNGYNGDNIQATDAEIFIPEGITVDTFGNIYIADAGNNRIRKINTTTGIIATVAGVGPSGVTLGGFAGDGGLATDAQLNGPDGLAIDKKGNIYIGDYCNNKVRRIDGITGVITTFAGVQSLTPYTGGFVGYSGDGGEATNAVLSGPDGVFADSVGNVYICDQWNHAIRKIDIATNIISTIAGTGIAGYSGDGGPATHAQLNQPGGVDMDRQGNIFIAEYGNGVIRKIDAATGTITTVAGKDTIGFSGDGGPATDAKLGCGDVRVDKFGTLYIADERNNRIRKVYNPKLAVPETYVKSDIKIYPNPAQNELTVEYDFVSSGDGTFQITDITGRVVAVKNLSSQKQEEEIDVSKFSLGLYLYKVVQNNVLISAGKFVKE